jgi:hypothetical protein
MIPVNQAFEANDIHRIVQEAEIDSVRKAAMEGHDPSIAHQLFKQLDAFLDGTIKQGKSEPLTKADPNCYGKVSSQADDWRRYGLTGGTVKREGPMITVSVGLPYQDFKYAMGAGKGGWANVHAALDALVKEWSKAEAGAWRVHGRIGYATRYEDQHIGGIWLTLTAERKAAA